MTLIALRFWHVDRHVIRPACWKRGSWRAVILLVLWLSGGLVGQAAGIPLFTFGYGSYADPGLTKMAQDTGGQFYQSPTTLEDLQLVFQDAAQLSSSTVGLVAGSGTVSSAQLSEFPVLVDASISRLTVSVSYVGAEADIDPHSPLKMRLQAPGNWRPAHRRMMLS